MYIYICIYVYISICMYMYCSPFWSQGFCFTAEFIHISRVLLMGKDWFVGSVGASLLREVDEGVWETVVHRRSHRESSFRGSLAAHGGLVEKKDAIERRSIMQRSIICFTS